MARNFAVSVELSKLNYIIIITRVLYSFTNTVRDAKQNVRYGILSGGKEKYDDRGINNNIKTNTNTNNKKTSKKRRVSLVNGELRKTKYYFFTTRNV